jgi:nucleoside-diphosphate-sugar epimerase
MKYFVTGATGFVGGRVSRMLLQAGHEVVVVARNPAKARDLADLGMHVHKGDVTDKASMRDPMRGVDGVYHIAGWYKVGTRDKSEGQAINVDGTRNVLELMRELDIPKGVYTSTLAVNSDTHGQIVDETYRFRGQHISIYDQTKWAAHFEVAEPMVRAGLPLVTVMPGLIYGPGDTSSARTTFLMYLQRKLPMIPFVSAYSWAHVDDIAQGHILAMEKGKVAEDYIIAGPTHTLIDALELAEQITGIPAPRTRVKPSQLKLLANITGFVEKFATLPEMYTAEYLRVSAGTTYTGSNAKAKAELGYRPRPLNDGLTTTLHHEMRLLGLPIPAGV